MGEEVVSSYPRAASFFTLICFKIALMCLNTKIYERGREWPAEATRNVGSCG